MEVRRVVNNDGSTGYMGFGEGAVALSSSNPVYASNTINNPILYDSASTEYEYKTSIDSVDSQYKDKDVVFRVMYEGNTKPSLKVKYGTNEYKTVEYDFSKSQELNDKQKSNMLWSEKQMDDGTIKQYAYITVPNDLLKTISGSTEWSIKSTNGVEIIGTKLTLPSASVTRKVEDVEITDITNATETTNASAKISWTAPENTKANICVVPCDENGKPEMITIKDKSGIPLTDSNGQEIKVENTGYIIAQGKENSESGDTFTLPGVIPSGKYIIRVDGTVDDNKIVQSGYSAPFDYVNVNTLDKPTNVELRDIGNGTLEVTMDLPEKATGANCLIYQKSIVTNEWEKMIGIGGYAGDFDNDGKIRATFGGGISLLDENGEASKSVSITPGNEYKVIVNALNLDEGTNMLPSQAVETTSIKLREPDRPQVEVSIVGFEKTQTDEKGIPYTQTDTDNMTINYEITNVYNSDGSVKSDFEYVDVKVLFNDEQLGDTLRYSETSGYKGSLDVNLTDGEHYVTIIATNKAGDRTVTGKKLSIDSIPSDIKIISPLQGSYADFENGIKLEMTSDIGATYEVILDGQKVDSDEMFNQRVGSGKTRTGVQNGKLAKTYVPQDPNQFSSVMQVNVTDPVGHITKYQAEVINEKFKDIDGISIREESTKTVNGMVTTELYAVAVDKDGKDIITLPKELVNWSVIDSDGSIRIVTDSENLTVVLKANEHYDYAIKAELKVTDDYSFTDIYTKYADNNTPVNPEDPSSGGASSSSTDTDIEKLLNQVKEQMSPTATVKTFEIYDKLDTLAQIENSILYFPENSEAGPNTLVMGVDKDTTSYSANLPAGSKIVSDVVDSALLEKPDGEYKYLVSLKYDPAKVTNTDNLGLYMYNHDLKKWLYVGGDINTGLHTIEKIVNSVGRYAVLENPTHIRFIDMNNRWSDKYVYALAYAGIINGINTPKGLCYEPGRNITRGEFIKLLVGAKAATLNQTDVSIFADKDTFKSYVIPYAATAYRLGWLKGSITPQGLMANLNDPITRQDAMVLIYRAFFDTLEIDNKLNYKDKDEISDYATDAVKYLNGTSIVNGFEDNTIRAKDYITREQTAKIIYETLITIETQRYYLK